MTHWVPNTCGVWKAPVTVCTNEQMTVMYVMRIRSESFPRPSSYKMNDRTEQRISVQPAKMCV